VIVGGRSMPFGIEAWNDYEIQPLVSRTPVHQYGLLRPPENASNHPFSTLA
jgi:hypothetical protein